MALIAYDEDHGLLRPDVHLSSKILARSQSTWSALSSVAHSTTLFPYPCTNTPRKIAQASYHGTFHCEIAL
ncbi:hypothetical protein BDV26DRAFT_274569 [Aspergillus bertholletiae]|uniref:Uncharacterized protein n=1 Tax=Aspergillus bertholletiae TaxID=1226010 RepID=A0A5N7AQV0_9EURO|nr:hypothetical protein BDV26DRAFT_274569 [Aspergillus bertholletiae]